MHMRSQCTKHHFGAAWTVRTEICVIHTVCAPCTDHSFLLMITPHLSSITHTHIHTHTHTHTHTHHCFFFLFLFFLFFQAHTRTHTPRQHTQIPYTALVCHFNVHSDSKTGKCKAGLNCLRIRIAHHSVM